MCGNGSETSDRRARGSAVVAMVLVLAIVAGSGAVLAATARVTAARARAQGAADAVALAAVVDRALASRVAQDDRVTIVALLEDASGVEVTVEVAGVRATARAVSLECRGSCLSIP